MRYHLESTLPIHAFQPVGGRHNPFKHGMTLEGGGGGGIVSAITDPISDVLGTSGDGGGILGAVEDVGQAIGGALADVDKAVGDTIPGGWGTVAAVAVPYAAPYLTGAALTAGQAAALAAGTSAVTGAVQGKSPEDILKNAALAGATSYGLNSLFSGAEGVPNFDADITAGAEGYANAAAQNIPLSEAIQLPSETPYVDMADTGTLLTPESTYNPTIDFDVDITASTQYPTIPTELDLNALYQDLPDGAVQLSYDQAPEVVAAATPAPTEEELKDKFFNELLNRSQSTYTPEGVQVFDYSTPASPETEKMVQTGYLERISQLPGYAYDLAAAHPYTTAALGLGALTLAGAGQQPVQEAPVDVQSTGSRRYTGGYGSSGGIPNQYLLRNRITSENVYDYENPYDRYAAINRRYAKGGEVKHFAFGGISNALTKAFQPIEKAVIQPIGRAVPFLREAAPYAGLIAAPFISSPIAAAGIGGLASGFGRPGSGFDMKRALMGGIAAYGASTLGAGLEAAGTTPTTAAPVSDLVTAPPGTVGEGLVSQTSSLVKEAPQGFFRSPEAMGRGIGNLVNPNTYDAAAKSFGTQAGLYKTGVPLIIGTSGMMAVDEAQKMKEEQDIAAAASKGEQQDMLARIAKGRRRAEEAVRSNPYMYAEGGVIPQTAAQLGGSISKFEPGNGPPPGMTWSETQGKWMPSNSVVGAMPSITNELIQPAPIPQQQPYMPIMPIMDNQGMRSNQREYEIANPDKPTDLDYKSGSPTSNLPPGFIPPSGPATAALEDFYNPQTKQRVTVGSGGYTPPPGFYNVTGMPVNRYPTPTVRPPDASTGYRPPPIPQNQFLIERMLNSRNIYSQPPMRMQPRPTSGLSALIQRQRFMPRRGFAMGGSIDDELGGDYSAMGMDQGNLQKGLFGMGYAAGGTPRFLSGGGDGMSDSIPATIGGTQEARLADGEFVIPADVVSHLGNGSSKAGAKQLYSMMDRVRKARTGNKKQGRQINPEKLMPA